MKPGTRLEVSKMRTVGTRFDWYWHISLYIRNRMVAHSLRNSRRREQWCHMDRAKAQADRFSKALGGIDVVVDER